MRPGDNVSFSWWILKISKLKWISAIREWSFCYSQRCPMLLAVSVVGEWPFGLGHFFDRHSSSTADDILSSKQRGDLFYTPFESWEQGEQLLCTSDSSRRGWPVENNFWTSRYRVQNRLCNSSSGDALTNRSRVRSPAAHRNVFVFFSFLPKDGKCLIRCLIKNVCPFNYNVCRTCSRSCIFRLCRFTCWNLQALQMTLSLEVFFGM